MGRLRRSAPPLAPFCGPEAGARGGQPHLNGLHCVFDLEDAALGRKRGHSTVIAATAGHARVVLVAEGDWAACSSRRALPRGSTDRGAAALGRERASAGEPAAALGDPSPTTSRTRCAAATLTCSRTYCSGSSAAASRRLCRAAGATDAGRSARGWWGSAGVLAWLFPVETDLWRARTLRRRQVARPKLAMLTRVASAARGAARRAPLGARAMSIPSWATVDPDTLSGDSPYTMQCLGEPVCHPVDRSVLPGIGSRRAAFRPGDVPRAAAGGIGRQQPVCSVVREQSANQVLPSRPQPRPRQRWWIASRGPVPQSAGVAPGPAARCTCSAFSIVLARPRGATVGRAGLDAW